MSVHLEEVPDCFNPPKKGVGILMATDDRFVNATEKIEALNLKKKALLINRLAKWTSEWSTGLNIKSCHGYDQSEYGGKYTMCYQFEFGTHRLYGFLMHPLESNPRFLVFVGVHIIEKRQWRTDEKVLKRIAELAANEEIIDAVRRFVYGYGRGK